MSSDPHASSHSYFYKILDAPAPSPLPETLPATPLDQKDGFIHLSTATQIPTTADLFFSHCTRLHILKLRVSDLQGEIRYVDGLPGCPHLHDSKTGLGRGNVEEVMVVERKDGEGWAEALMGFE